MKIVTSPAKLMSLKNATPFLKSTTPNFIEDAAFLQSFLKSKTPKDLADLMEISPKLADENWERNQKWNPKPKKSECTQALMAFTGEVYRGLDATTLTEAAVGYLQKNYRILSGLYGLLKPSDKVMLYRLEMGRNFEFDSYKNLYSFWSEKVTEQLSKEMKKNEVLLLLASAEYAKVIDKKKLNRKIVEFEFLETQPDGKLKNIVVYTKHARGLVTRFCAMEGCKTLEDVKAFHYDRYLLDEERTTDTKLVFKR